MLLGHLIELGRRVSAGLLGHVHAHEAQRGTSGVVGGIPHGLILGSGKLLGRHLGGAEGGGRLILLNLCHVLIQRRHAGDADVHDFQTPLVPPLLAEDIVQGVRQLHGVHLQSAVADAHFGNSAERHAQRAQQLGTKLLVQAAAGIGFGNVAADMLVEQHRVADAIGEHTEAAQTHIHVKTHVVVHHPEGDGAGGAVLVAGDLLGVEVVNALILGRLSAEGKALSEFIDGLAQTVAEVTAEHTGRGGGIIGIFAGLGGKFHDLALIHDHHALTVGHQNHGAGGDDVVASLVVDAAPAAGLFALQGQNPLGHRVTGEKLLPLIRQHAAGGIQSRTNKTHNHSPLLSSWWVSF